MKQKNYMKSTNFRLELLEIFDGEEHSSERYVKLAIILFQCRDIPGGGTETTYKRIGILTETEDDMYIIWDDIRNWKQYPGSLYSAISSIQNYIAQISNSNINQ